MSHPYMSEASHRCAVALEDACTLAAALSQSLALRSPYVIPSGWEAYLIEPSLQMADGDQRPVCYIGRAFASSDESWRSWSSSATEVQRGVWTGKEILSLCQGSEAGMRLLASSEYVQVSCEEGSQEVLAQGAGGFEALGDVDAVDFLDGLVDLGFVDGDVAWAGPEG